MPELRGLSRQARFDIAQALALGQLCERHNPVLLSTGRGLNRVIAVITGNDPCERAPGQTIHQLREQRLSGVHWQALHGKGSGKSPPDSNRHHRKSPENSTSTQFVRKTPDSSEYCQFNKHDIKIAE
jgi:hypothetical protein